MTKAAITVLGTDRPGIVYKVAELLDHLGCNIIDISQTVLQEEFAGIFIVNLPEGLEVDYLDAEMSYGLRHKNLYSFTKPIQTDTELQKPKKVKTEPFVVVCIGQNRVGLIAAVTSVMKDHEVNITNLKFINRTPSFPEQSVTIYEVDIPKDVQLNNFIRDLQERTKNDSLEINVQHKKIFQDICRI